MSEILVRVSIERDIQITQIEPKANDKFLSRFMRDQSNDAKVNNELICPTVNPSLKRHSKRKLRPD